MYKNHAKFLPPSETLADSYIGLHNQCICISQIPTYKNTFIDALNVVRVAPSLGIRINRSFSGRLVYNFPRLEAAVLE